MTATTGARAAGALTAAFAALTATTWTATSPASGAATVTCQGHVATIVGTPG